MSETVAQGGRKISDGDLVVVYESYDCMKAVRVESKRGQLNNRHGAFLHRSWIGKCFGSKVFSSDGGGFVHLLAPTPELWTLVLKHRTQILYAADISLVCLKLDLRPGSTVLETGTGSGSLTTSLSRAVGPEGLVRTFEFHKERAEAAEAEFKDNALANVRVTHRNIERDGFPEELQSTADAVFLDLPGPWKVVPSAAACLKPDGCFCSFSPCIEQVQQTCAALAESGFRDIRTEEILLRYYKVSKQSFVMDADCFDSVTRKSAKAGEGAAGRKRARGEEQEAPAAETETAVVCQPEESARGHTGYLTFARLRTYCVAG